MDKCAACGSRLFLQDMRYKAEGDDSPDTETVIYHVVNQVCKNPKCVKCGAVQGTVQTRIN